MRLAVSETFYLHYILFGDAPAPCSTYLPIDGAVSHTRSANVVVRKKKTFQDDSLFQSALRAQVAYLDGHKHIETTQSLCNPKRHRFGSDYEYAGVR